MRAYRMRLVNKWSHLQYYELGGSVDSYNKMHCANLSDTWMLGSYRHFSIPDYKMFQEYCVTVSRRSRKTNLT